MKDWRTDFTLDGRGPVYEQIKRAVTSRIHDGVWETGHRLPGEEDFATHLQAARMTVNRALRELTDEGFLVRRRGSGTFVAEPPSPAALLEIVDMSQAIPARGADYAYECLRQEVVEARGVTAERLRLAEGDALRHVVCRHRADGEVVELEERWINLGLLPEAAEVDFSEFGPGGWLLSAVPWSEAEHTVSAQNAGEDQATLLETRVGAACLVLERRTFQGDDVVTWARLTHPGDRHRMTGRFSPGTR